MASLDQLPSEDKAPIKEKSGGDKDVNQDAKLVSMMGMAMLDKGGLEIISKALDSSQDPGQVVAQFIAQMAGQLAEFTAKNLDIDPGVYAQPNGFIEQILGYIEMKLKLPQEFSDQVLGEVMEVMKAAAQSPPGEQAPQGAPPAGPPQAPQGAPPQVGPGLDQQGVM
jgi:hypothetical protein